jgi:hypothetical protein
VVARRASRILPFLRVLNASLRNDRWPQFRQACRDALAAMAGQTAAPADLRDAPPRLLQLASGYWISQTLYVAAKLGIADILSDGPKTSAEIAGATGADARAVSRLIRALCTVGVLRANGAGQLSVMPLGRPLQSDVPGSLRALVITLGEVHYAAWAHLLHSVTTGAAAFPHRFGVELFDYLSRDGDAGRVFNQAMTEYSALASRAVLLAYDFSGIPSILDVGGGCGTLLMNILHTYPSMDGTLFEMPSVIAEARTQLARHPCRERCALIPGNCLAVVPAGSQVYLLSGVIHDWDDVHAVKILQNCRRAMAPDGKVLLVECVVPAETQASFSTLLDLNVLVMNGGRERTAVEFRNLFDAAGFSMTRVVPTLSPLSVLEATPK